MLLKKIKKYWISFWQSKKRKYILFILILIMAVAGYIGLVSEKEEKSKNNKSAQQELQGEFIKIMEGAEEIYENFGKGDSYEFQKKLVEYLGGKGYAAVDSDSQMDMVHGEQVEKYCENAGKNKKDQVIIFRVLKDGGIVGYELHTDGKEMDAVVSTLRWTDHKFRMTYCHKFNVHSWKYTEKGYFFIEEYRPPGFDGQPGVTGFRVKPLNQKCRELNRKYVLPVGYKLNNMLITNWNEKDYSKLDFYDLYELQYPNVYGKEIPYAMEEGAEYHIPGQEFEQVLQTLFSIKSERIQKNAAYDPDTQKYRYRPRGSYEYQFPYEPYSEVVSYEKLNDGKLKLVIEAVWEIEMMDQAIKSELVVEPLEEGKFRYVSNTVLRPKEDKPEWYVPRLKDGQWTELYGSREKPEEIYKKDKIENSGEEVSPKGYDLPIEDKEQETAEKDCIAVLNLIQDIYRDADKGKALNVVLENSVMEEMKKKLGTEQILATSAEEYSVMENYQEMEGFLYDSEQGISGETVLYTVLKDGGIDRKKFIYDGQEMYLLTTKGGWKNEMPIIISHSFAKIKQWRYTEKGWFAYELCVPEPPEVSEIMDGSCMIRVRPLDQECIELSKKCVFPLGYQGNNILRSNWDESCLDKLDYNGSYEFFYQMKYEEKFVMEEGKTGIPAKKFEKLITEYLPVTEDQLRNIAVFDADKKEYPWAKLGAGIYMPTHFETSLPEVINVKENQGGSQTLTVEAVCDMLISDDAVITHELTVKFREDGSFQYLGNKILENGSKNIPDYQYRV